VHTSLTNYRHLQVYQSKCLRVIGDFPRSTPIPHLHDHLQVIPIRHYIYQLTERFFMRCSTQTNPLIQNIGNTQQKIFVVKTLSTYTNTLNTFSYKCYQDATALFLVYVHTHMDHILLTDSLDRSVFYVCVCVR
jgi:hypothetical protein